MATVILVGYDPRTADRAPVRFGVMAARPIGAPLVVGSVSAGLGEGSGEPLDDLRRDLQTEGVQAACRPLPGASTPAALHGAAQSFGAGLLVVGSTTRGEVSQMVGGSTAERLLYGAPCPVAVVPFGWEEPRTEAKLRVVWVDADAVDADADAHDAAGSLIELSRIVDLLVCGTGGQEVSRAILAGRVARQVMSAAHCPVIVVAPGDYAGLEALLGTIPTTRVPMPTPEP
jgi:nucleotide-binding universal stress UspA family protein